MGNNEIIFKRKDLTGLYNLSKEEILFFLKTAESFEEVLERDVKKVPTLRGKSVVTLFYEPSTRTRTSFETAAKILSADVMNITVNASSVTKGESLKDTVKNIEAMGVDALIIRHSSSGAADYIARLTKMSIINGGDGWHEHPTQALLDLLTIKSMKKTLTNLKVAIVGDILHSRVARSNLFALKKLGNEVRLVGPKTFIPEYFKELGGDIYYSLEEGLDGVDVIMVLRLQKERMGKNYYPSEREYAQRFGINKKSLEYAKEDVLIMHPGPVNRGLEISSDILDGEHSVVLTQVKKGVAVRMAVLYLLLVGGKGEDNN